MDANIRQWFLDRDSPDPDRGYQALLHLFEAADKPVDWAYEVWDKLAAELTKGDNHQRAFSAQMLARLAVSDPEGRMNALFPTLFGVTRDERTVTARHALGALWRVGLASPALRRKVIEALEKRFHEVAGIKQGNIYRPDIVAGLSKLYAATGEDSALVCAEALIESEPDLKARKKLQTAWRKPPE